VNVGGNLGGGDGMGLLRGWDNEREGQAGTLFGGKDQRVFDCSPGTQESLEVARSPNCRVFRVSGDDPCS